MPNRLLFISYSHTPRTASGTPSGEFGFGDLSVEIDFPIRDQDDLKRAFLKGLAEKGVTGKILVVLNWRFFEE